MRCDLLRVAPLVWSSLYRTQLLDACKVLRSPFLAVSHFWSRDLKISVVYHNAHLFSNVWVYRSA